MKCYLADEASQKWKHWTPSRDDAKFVGRIGNHVFAALSGYLRVRDVYIVPGTVEHILTIHKGEFNFDRAAGLVLSTIADPLAVYQGRKPTTLVFVGRYDVDHFLVVPIKALPDELWQESLYIADITGFLRRRWVREGLLWEFGH